MALALTRPPWLVQRVAPSLYWWLPPPPMSDLLQTSHPGFLGTFLPPSATRNKALKRVQKHPTQQNIENYRIIRAKTRRVIKTSRRHSWQTYVCKINSRASIKKVWSMVRKIAGKSPATNIKHLNLNNTEITEIPDIVNSFGNTFSNNSSIWTLKGRTHRHERYHESKSSQPSTWLTY